ncbi:DUF3450 domain-containing [Micractinium conductrix]|uniref:DUF3450 domain-containing n=1 Tax=Micractinium conductrix TaxID=554055 RepID=A0A2P6V6D8_9CHLO|nr:DUF3450 domain-containing [Micractinium conductrix]|eukprot:PSC69641.1 DUF3450 domain-containing [Micractinium conductrix]
MQAADAERQAAGQPPLPPAEAAALAESLTQAVLQMVAAPALAGDAGDGVEHELWGEVHAMRGEEAAEVAWAVERPELVLRYNRVALRRYWLAEMARALAERRQPVPWQVPPLEAIQEADSAIARGEETEAAIALEAQLAPALQVAVTVGPLPVRTLSP